MQLLLMTGILRLDEAIAVFHQMLATVIDLTAVKELTLRDKKWEPCRSPPKQSTQLPGKNLLGLMLGSY